MTRSIIDRIEDAQVRLNGKGAKPALIVLTGKDLVELEAFLGDQILGRAAVAERRFELPPMPMFCNIEVRWSPDRSRLQGAMPTGGRIAEDI